MSDQHKQKQAEYGVRYVDGQMQFTDADGTVMGMVADDGGVTVLTRPTR